MTEQQGLDIAKDIFSGYDRFEYDQDEHEVQFMHARIYYQSHRQLLRIEIESKNSYGDTVRLPMLSELSKRLGVDPDNVSFWTCRGGDEYDRCINIEVCPVKLKWDGPTRS